MLAARANRGSHSLTLEEVEVPEPGPGDALVKVASAGLAYGMMTLLERGAFRHLPTTVGHEAAGTVVALGPEVGTGVGAGTGVGTVAVGDRVRVHPNLSCRNCRYCRTDREQMCADAAMIGHAAHGDGPMPLYARYHDGGLAEFIRVPAWTLDPVPDGVGFDLAAKVHDLGNAVRALRCADLPLGGTLLVTAATGTMGTATVKLAPLFGAARLVLVGRSAERLDGVRPLAGSVPVDTVALEELGDWEADRGLTRRLRELMPDGADALIDYTPQGAATGQALGALGMGGTMLHMGGNTAPLGLPTVALMRNMWRIMGNRSCTRTDAVEVLRLLESGVLEADELITHRFPLADLDRAIKALRDRGAPLWMAVVHP